MKKLIILLLLLTPVVAVQYNEDTTQNHAQRTTRAKGTYPGTGKYDSNGWLWIASKDTADTVTSLLEWARVHGAPAIPAAYDSAGVAHMADTCKHEKDTVRAAYKADTAIHANYSIRADSSRAAHFADSSKNAHKSDTAIKAQRAVFADSSTNTHKADTAIKCQRSVFSDSSTNTHKADTAIKSQRSVFADSSTNSHKSDTALDAGKLGGYGMAYHDTVGHGAKAPKFALTQYYIPAVKMYGDSLMNSLIAQNSGATQLAVGGTPPVSGAFYTVLAGNYAGVTTSFTSTNTTYGPQFSLDATGAGGNEFRLVSTPSGNAVIGGPKFAIYRAATAGLTYGYPFFIDSLNKTTLTALSGATAPGSPILQFAPSNGAGGLFPTYGFQFCLETSATGDLYWQRMVNGVNTTFMQIARASGNITLSNYTTNGVLKVTGGTGLVGASTTIDSGAVGAGKIAVGVTNNYTLTASNLSEASNILTLTDSIFANGYGIKTTKGLWCDTLIHTKKMYSDSSYAYDNRYNKNYAGLDSGAVTVGTLPVAVTNTHTFGNSYLTQTADTLFSSKPVSAYGFNSTINSSYFYNVKSVTSGSASSWLFENVGSSEPNLKKNSFRFINANTSAYFYIDTLGGMHANGSSSIDVNFMGGSLLEIINSNTSYGSLITFLGGSVGDYGGAYPAFSGSNGNINPASMTGLIGSSAGLFLSTYSGGNIYITPYATMDPAVTVRADSILLKEPIQGGNANYSGNVQITNRLYADTASFRTIGFPLNQYSLNWPIVADTSYSWASDAATKSLVMQTRNHAGYGDMIRFYPNKTIAMAPLATANTGIVYAKATTGELGATNVAAGTVLISSSTVGVAPSVITQSSSMIGIGEPAYVKLQVYSAVSGAPATSGTAETYGIMRLRGSNQGVLDIGQNGNDLWMQVTDQSNLANHYNLILQQNGGLVGIGCTPGNKLTIAGDLGFSTVQTVTMGGNDNTTAPTSTNIEVCGSFTWTPAAGTLPDNTLAFVSNSDGSSPSVATFYQGAQAIHNCGFWMVKKSGHWYRLIP